MKLSWDKRKLGIAWGLTVSMSDINTFFLYFGLLYASPTLITCDNFLSYYTLFVMISTILIAVFYPISGWLTDMLALHNSYLGRSFSLLTVTQLVLFVIQLIPLYLNSTHGWLILCIAWLLSQLVNLQSTNVAWKLIKLLAEDDMYLVDPNDTADFVALDIKNNKLETINRTGNVGDLSSDMVETTSVVILALFIVFIDGFTPYHSILYLVVLYCLIAGVVTLLATTFWHYIPVFTSFSFESINSEDKVGANWFTWLKTNFKELCKPNNKIALHAFLHCICLNIYTSLVQYPLSLIEARHLIIIHYDDQSRHNYCGGVVTNLMLLGAVTNGSYLFGSIWYRVFIVGTTPPVFYKWWYPCAAILLFGLTTALWFNLPSILGLVFVSVATIIPYYLTYFDYYLFTEKYDEKHYGFMLGLYGIVTTSLTLASQYLYLIGLSFTILIILCVSLVAFNIFYSLYLARLTKV